MPNIMKVLELSIEHLPARLRADLNGEDGVIAVKDESDTEEYGWWVWVPEHPADHAADYWDYPAGLLTVQSYARQYGCDWIRFDRDAEVDHNLLTYIEDE